MRNIKNKILIFGLSSMLLGCSQSATSVFDTNPSYGQHVQYSKVIKSISGENVNAIFNITYLNSVDTLRWDNNTQNFLIGAYTFDHNENDFNLTMNNKVQVSKKEVFKTDPLYKNIAFRNGWAKYYVITFENSDKKILTIKYTHPKFQSIQTTFQKE